MVIEELTRSFNKFKSSQKNAISAIKEIADIDCELAAKLFSISEFDIHMIKQIKTDDAILAAMKNSHLFTIITPEPSEVECILKRNVLATLPSYDENIKNSMLKYAYAQRSAILNIKKFISSGEDITRICFDFPEKSIQFIKEHDEETLLDLADKYTWLLRMNYSKRSDVFYESAELLKFHNHYVESTLNYTEHTY